ncbi:MAG: pyridoxamine 5'-phosphate oxidase family protein, partial [Candidatus Bathyarchaeia archaeon]
MAFVTDEIRNFVKDVSRGIVATVDRDGQPHVSVKNGRLRKDGTLELWNVFGEETVQNIEA